MLFAFNNQWLTASLTEVGGDGKGAGMNVRVNGVRVTQASEVIGAARQTFFDRANAAVTIGFDVDEEHDSIADAGRHFYRAFDTSPTSGPLDIYAGTLSGGWHHLRVTGAKLRGVAPIRQDGVRTLVNYQILGGGVDYIEAIAGTGGSAPDVESLVDGGSYSTSYSQPQNGTVDGAWYGEVFLDPDPLALDAGTY